MAFACVPAVFFGPFPSVSVSTLRPKRASTGRRFALFPIQIFDFRVEGSHAAASFDSTDMGRDR
jgi:hypothetical protein